jgi:DNA (cytosine-5)-methyltransferase 1
MAGYRVVWANEFVPMAQACHRANFPACHLDGRDVRDVEPRDILAATGFAEGGLDLLDGSPPCQAFSMAGQRARGWGRERAYEHGATQKNETLFTEYIRILRGLMPRAFVAENVSGLVKGVAKGFFKEILRDLQASGYRVEARLLDAQWLGVPQQRQRIIFQGVRRDLERQPAWPAPLPYRYSVRDALPWLGQVTNPAHGFMKENDIRLEHPAPTVPASPSSTYTGHQVAARVIHDTGGFVRDKDVTDRPCPAITNGVGALNSCHYQVVWHDGGAWDTHDVTDVPAPTGRSGRAATLLVEGANGFDGHVKQPVDRPMPTAQAGRPVHVMDGHETDISRYAIGREWDALRPGGQSGRYFQLVRADPASPCPTVTQSGGNLSTAGVTHPSERRKFTIAELKRICAFPDDFILVGSYAQQWERLGNSVPPVMMAHLAAAIRDGILSVSSA